MQVKLNLNARESKANQGHKGDKILPVDSYDKNKVYSDVYQGKRNEVTFI